MPQSRASIESRSNRKDGSLNRRGLFAALLAVPVTASAQASFGKTIALKPVKESFAPDGKTTVFMLSYAPQSNQGFLLFYNKVVPLYGLTGNVVMAEGVDYTLSGKTLTVPPVAGPPIGSQPTLFPLTANDRLWAQYWAEFSV